MTNEDIEKYKRINSSEVTKEIKFAEYLQKGLSYREVGKETFKYLTKESSPRIPPEFRLIPSHQAKITMQITQNNDKDICTNNTTKRMTLYISQFQGEYKFIEPMCDVQLAAANATAVSEKFQKSFAKKINLDSLKDKYKNEGLMGIKNYAKETNIPQAIVFETYNTRIYPSF
ncbi:hypothetical protein [Kangiella shandongensis]|uniref:hypothetical protein n=1 Tax=Kangiella shandongensis TaxID=2763258 RepID=UPI001CC1AF29|nr:hypothetical protein [Kangiella shandongensis]